MLRKIVIKNLRPNPFRRLDEYPIQREKVDALKKSINTTGFWGTIVGRPVGRELIEIAFGHHRLVAIQEAMVKDESVEIIVRDLSNEDMLRMMANENMEEWGASGWVELETVRSTIDAYGKGLIALPAVPEKARKTLIRYVSLNPDSHGYTMGTVAEFLGWTKKNHDDGVRPSFACETAFKALDAIRDGLIKEMDLKGLTRGQIYNLLVSAQSIRTAETRAAEENRKEAEIAKKRAALAPSPTERRRFEKQATIHEEQAEQHATEAVVKAKDFSKEAADRLRNGDGVIAIRERAKELAPVVEQPAKVHSVDDLASRIARKLENIVNGDDDLSGDIAFLKQCKGDLSPVAAKGLCQSSAALRARLMDKIEKAFNSI